MKKDNLSGNNTSLIAKGMEFQGDLHFSGILEIEGQVTGNIIARPDAVAEVRIREAGEVRGLIRVPVVIVNGLVEGDIYSSNHLELAAKAKVTGNIYYHLMEVVLGCRVQGLLSHKSSADIAQLNGSQKSIEMQENPAAQSAVLLPRH